MNPDERDLLAEYKITDEDDLTTVSHILRGRLKLSQRLYRRLKREHGILLNGDSVYVNAVVRTGDMIRLLTEPEGSGDTIPEPMDLDIVHEDNDIILLNKPVGICVHPTHGHWTGTLANGLAGYFIDMGIRTRVRPVHRLDMDTSGLVLFAKNQLSHQKLADQLEGHTLDRQYLAIALGDLQPDEGTLSGPIMRNPENRKERIVAEDGRISITHFRVLERFGRATMVRLILETGRTHQIRVHMAHAGHPLVGDPMYLKECLDAGHWNDLPDAVRTFPRQALHADSIRFTHPTSGEPTRFEVPLPKDMQGLVDHLRDTISYFTRLS